MTAPSLFYLHVARHLRRVAGTARLNPPLWPIVFLAIVWWGVSFCSGADADWVGRSREEVVAELGKPLSALQRGETQVLMYANNVRVEIRDDVVVGFRSGDGAVIVKSDGSRYTPTDRGRVKRVVAELPEGADAEERPHDVAAPAKRNDGANTAEASSSPAAVQHVANVATPATEPLAPDAAEPFEDEEEFADEDSLVPEGAAGHPDAATQALEHFAATGTLPLPEEEDVEDEPPAWARATEQVIAALLRFGFAALMLRIAISWVELPCYMPDVLKVAALYTVTREGVHGLAELGGHWEWIRLFRLDDGISFVALAYLLYKFKIALAGITALKIACATKLVTYFLMLIAGVAISFGLGNLY